MNETEVWGFIILTVVIKTCLLLEKVVLAAFTKKPLEIFQNEIHKSTKPFLLLKAPKANCFGVREKIFSLVA